MSLSASDVNNMAWLARIKIDTEDTDAYARDLSGILEFVEQMNNVDTADVAPMAHPLDQSQRLRADEVTEVDRRDEFQAQAPQVEAGLFLVPKVIE